MNSLDQLATVASEGEEETNNISNGKLIPSKAEQMDAILSESFDDVNQEKGQNANEVNDIEKNIASEINVARTKNVFAQEGTADDDKEVNDGGEAATNISGDGNEERINGKLEEDALVKGLDNNNAITADEREHVNNVEKASNADDALECKEDKHENGEETAEVKISVKGKKKRNSKKKALQILSGVATINNAQKPETGSDELASKEPIRIDTPIGIDKMSVEKASNADGTLVKECKEEKHENGEVTAEVKTSVKVNKKRKKKALQILSGVATMNNAQKPETGIDELSSKEPIGIDMGIGIDKMSVEKASNVDDALALVKECKEDKHENGEETAEVKISVKVNKKRNKIKKKKALQILSGVATINNAQKPETGSDELASKEPIRIDTPIGIDKMSVEKASNADGTLVKECKEEKHENGEVTAEVKTSVKVNKKRKKKALQILSGVATMNNAQKPETGIDELSSKEPIGIDMGIGIDKMSVEKASNADDALALVKECKEDKHENGEETAEVKISVKVNKKRNKIKKKKALQILSGVATINNAQKPETGIDELASKEPIKIDTPIGIDKTPVEKASNADDALVKECKEDKHENGEDTAEVKIPVKVNKIKKKKALQILSGVATINNAQKPETGIDELASKEPIRIDTPIGIDKTPVEKASNADDALVKECKEDKQENSEETAEVKIPAKVNKKQNKIKKKKALQILSGVATINNAQKPETGIDELASKEPIRIDTLGKNKDIPILPGVVTVEDAQKPGSGNDELASKEPIGIDKPAVEHEEVSKGANMSNSSKDGKSSKKNDCKGMIFLCNSDTKKDCFRYKVFGMPVHVKDLVKKGMRLFLFDVDLRMMYGIYRACRPRCFNIEPKAFNSQFPCQVRFSSIVEGKPLAEKKFRQVQPLAEKKFRQVLKEFHYTPTDYNFPLNKKQVAKLCKLFVKNSKKRKRTKAPVTRSSAKAASGKQVAAAASSSAQLNRKRKREKDSHLEQKSSSFTCDPSGRLYLEYYRAAENNPPALLYRS